MNKYVTEILKKMCEMVDADYTTIDFTAPTWFWLYEWTTDQENEFKEWMYNYLKGSGEARKTVMEFPTINKVRIIKVCDEFVNQFGWKIKTETV